MLGISCVVFPIPDHAFFEQADFRRLLRHHLLQRGGLLAQVLYLVGGRSPGRIARQTPLAGLREPLGPAIIHGLGNTLPPAQLGYAVLAAKAIQHNPDLVLGRVMLASGAADVLQNPLRRRFKASWVRSHRQSFLKAMRPNSSLS